jgi:hypothetical protein
MTIDEISKLPNRKLYRELARRTFEQEVKQGGVKLTTEQRRFSLAAELHGETMNGGLRQYFTNSSGKNCQLALAALRAIGAKRQEELVLMWLEALPASVRPDVPNEVGRYIFSTPSLARELEQIDQQYFAAAESFYQVVADYVKAHAQSFGIAC